MPAAKPDPGSFRDPLSRIYVQDGAVYRALSATAQDDFDAVEGTSFFTKALANGRIIGTERLAKAPKVPDGDRWAGWLRHDPVPVLSYPYEWSFEMLKDAAILQIDLLREGLTEGVMCKDATSFNIQFVGAKPVFIDVGSFEKQRSGEPWYGRQQFLQLFLYPLMFQAYKDIAFQTWLRGDIAGITPSDAKAVLGGLATIRKGVIPNVVLQAVLSERMADTKDDVKAEMAEAGMSNDIIKAQLDKVAGLLPKLEWNRSSSVWSNYSDRGHYTDADLKRKSEFVGAVAALRPRKVTWDIGSNDGHFSRIAAEHSEQVIALDGDHLVIDTLYKVLRKEQNRKILPLVMDIAASSPGLGWRGRERRPFTERAAPDLVLALAVIHHIAITSLVPIQEFIDFLGDLGTEVVIEFPTPDDQMVKRLLRNKRAGVHDDYNLAEFERHVDRRFEVATREELPSGTRVLYHLVPRG